MTYHVLDLEQYPRRAHFDYFRSMTSPYVGITVEVDITDFLYGCRERGYSFFLTFLHTVSRAANAVPELRQRIVGESIVIFDHCETSHTVLCDDETYSYCRLDCSKPLEEFLSEAAKAHVDAKLHPTLDDGDDVFGLLFISCLPWVSYTALVQPIPTPVDSNPRITWGKYFSRGDRTLLPVTLLAHHALVDGIHLSMFYEALDRCLSEAFST